MSLDGYMEDESGGFAWFPPDDEVFAFITGLVRSVGSFLYGRRLHEMMAVWETDAALPAQSDLMADFATAWQAANKVVYSTTLTEVSTAVTSLERRFDPAAVRQLKATADRDITIGGANLAAQAIRAGLVDEPVVRLAQGRRRRQVGAAYRRAHRLRAAWRTPIPQRRRSPPLPPTRPLRRGGDGVVAGAGRAVAVIDS
ncbi:dihydrofolate reductase family protein [Micromonospora sp. DT229]|uniref:dihydrofolate reductase family protein n=1 Tax=Micromonospora sp. DT229 TaxID=3393430 RepID=UPI003CFA320E